MYDLTMPYLWVRTREDEIKHGKLMFHSAEQEAMSKRKDLAESFTKQRRVTLRSRLRSGESLNNVLGVEQWQEIDRANTQSGNSTVGQGSELVAQLSSLVGDLQGRKGKRVATRPCWWSPSVHAVHSCAVVHDEASRRHLIGVQQQVMLRRSTMEYCFSVAQLRRILAVVRPC